MRAFAILRRNSGQDINGLILKYNSVAKMKIMQNSGQQHFKSNFS
jgi:hypothetical protein